MIYSNRDSTRGWVYALTKSEVSNWGISEREFDWILQGKRVKGSNNRVHYQCMSTVWGKINDAKKVELPKPSDGIAFYHPKGKAVGLDGKLCKVAEFSVIGTIQEIEFDPDKTHISFLKANFQAENVDAFLSDENRLVLNKSMAPVEAAMTAGLKPGQVASCWQIPSTEWKNLLAFAGIASKDVE